MSAKDDSSFPWDKMDSGAHDGEDTENDDEQQLNGDEQLLLEQFMKQASDLGIDLTDPHVKEMLRVQLESIVGKTALYSGALSIQTTINRKMQEAAQAIFTAEMIKLRSEFGKDIDGGMIVIDRKTGEIKALVGGFDFTVSKFNKESIAF